MLVVAFYGGPGSGKSTMAAATFAELKWCGINCELVTEVAKDIVWDDATAILRDQLYILAQQARRVRRLEGKVDVVVTDSPILLSLVYGDSDILSFLALEEYAKYPSLNYFILRSKSFSGVGRVHTENEARDLDTRILAMLTTQKIPFSTLPHVRSSVGNVVDAVNTELCRKK